MNRPRHQVFALERKLFILLEKVSQFRVKIGNRILKQFLVEILRKIAWFKETFVIFSSYHLMHLSHIDEKSECLACAMHQAFILIQFFIFSFFF